MNNITPPLDMDLGTIDTSRHYVAPGLYDLKVAKVEVKPTKKNDGEYLNITLETTSPTKSIKGEDMGAGAQVYDIRMLNPTGKATWDMVGKNLAELFQGAKLSGIMLSQAKAAAPQLVGRIIRTKVGFEPAEGSNKDQNTVISYLKQ